MFEWGGGGRFSGRYVGVLEKKKVLFFKGVCHILEKKRSSVGFCLCDLLGETDLVFFR